MGTFFISRPVFAWVVAIITMLAGAFSLMTLPVSQYPEIAPTTIRVSASYSGATAETVESSVTRPIEDSLTGLDGLLYMEASSSQGSSSITLTFDESVDPIDAQNDVQNKISRVEGQLPSSVQSSGVSVSRSDSSILLVGALVATDGGYDSAELGDILGRVAEGPIERTEGVGGMQVFGSGYAMRIWLDPFKLARFQLTPSDIVSAVQEQNTSVAVGSLGAQPSVVGQQFSVTITAQSQLESVDSFERILLKADEGGGAVYLGDIATIEIGREDYGGGARYSGLPSAAFGVNMSTGANAIDTAVAVKATLESLAAALPDGVEFRIGYDTSPFVERSINQVYTTLIEAVVLVFVVLLVFLQAWRTTLIPLIAVPVVLLGAFVALAATGYTINTLTMFAMVLAIGLLVDDAIVVVENVERLMTEEGLSPFQATKKSMGQIFGALVGIAVVLSAVFLPMAFFEGSTGVIYRQFSVTIVTAMILSLAVALILTPALCATILRRNGSHRPIAPARWFNSGFDWMTRRYAGGVRWLSAKPLISIVLILGTVGGAWAVYERMTTSFLPTEDQGMLMAIVTLDEGATQTQTLGVVDELESYLLEEESAGVKSTTAALGFGFSGSGENRAMVFVQLKDFDERADPALSAGQIAQRANMRFTGYRKAQVYVMQPPAVRGLGNSGGFTMYLIDQAGEGAESLRAAGEQLVALAAADARLQSVRASSSSDESVLRINIDQHKLESFGVSLSDVNGMLSIIFSGSEVNDFVLGSDLRPVIVQAEAEWRMQPDDIEAWYARNSDGEMVPFSAFVTTSWEPAPPQLQRYGGSSAMQIQGSAADGVSSGEAMTVIEDLAAQIRGGYGVAWTGLSYQERQSGDQAPILYALSVLIVFLALAALYESWTIPLAVIFIVPIGVFGALLVSWLFDQSDDVYFKVGVLTTIGLAARNAILIIEFAETLYAEGRDLVDAATMAGRQRLRPIMMTALTFILGVLPLALASGAGAAAQNAIGFAVIGGMISSTTLAIFIAPAFWVLIRRIVGRPKPVEDEAAA